VRSGYFRFASPQGALPQLPLRLLAGAASQARRLPGAVQLLLYGKNKFSASRCILGLKEIVATHSQMGVYLPQSEHFS
jgi:hypothetical protein